MPSGASPPRAASAAATGSSPAGVGAPTLYHHFGDKQGLFDAVVTYGFERYLEGERAQPATGDPVDDLRRGWDPHVEFGRTNPAFHALTAAEQALLHEWLQRLAQARG